MSPRVDLIGVPLDLGAGRRGVDMGPSAFRVGLLSMDVVELNPTLDVRNRSAEVGAELILSALAQRIL